jgi:hypothetical protein
MEVGGELHTPLALSSRIASSIHWIGWIGSHGSLGSEEEKNLSNCLRSNIRRVTS